MEIASLRTVLLVQSQGSLAGAARILDIDPSSVSRIVAGVEAELGIRLFQRTTRRLAETEEGKVYLQRLAPLINEMEAAHEEALGKRSQPTGLIRMTASVAFSYQMIVPMLPDFQHLYPDITVDLQSSDANLDLIENGIDLAIRLAPAPKGDLISARLIRTVYKVVASPDYIKGGNITDNPWDLQELNCLRFALPSFQNQWRFRMNDNPPFNVPIAGNLMLSNALTLRKAARMGMGIALLADWLIEDDLRNGRLVELFSGHHSTATDFDTAAWCLYPSRAYLPRKVRVMIEFLRSNLNSVRI